jgi:hypothetical protein
VIFFDYALMSLLKIKVFAMGPQQGQKVFTLQTLPASNEGEYGSQYLSMSFSNSILMRAASHFASRTQEVCSEAIK